MFRWFRYLRNYIKGPTKMDIYGVSDRQYEWQEKFLNDRMYWQPNPHYNEIFNEDMEKRHEHFRKFLANGSYRGWYDRKEWKR